MQRAMSKSFDTITTSRNCRNFGNMLSKGSSWTAPMPSQISQYISTVFHVDLCHHMPSVKSKQARVPVQMVRIYAWQSVRPQLHHSQQLLDLDLDCYDCLWSVANLKAAFRASLFPGGVSCILMYTKRCIAKHCWHLHWDANASEYS